MSGAPGPGMRARGPVAFPECWGLSAPGSSTRTAQSFGALPCRRPGFIFIFPYLLPSLFSSLFRFLACLTSCKWKA